MDLDDDDDIMDNPMQAVSRASVAAAEENFQPPPVAAAPPSLRKEQQIEIQQEKDQKEEQQEEEEDVDDDEYSSPFSVSDDFSVSVRSRAPSHLECLAAVVAQMPETDLEWNIVFASATANPALLASPSRVSLSGLALLSPSEAARPSLAPLTAAIAQERKSITLTANNAIAPRRASQSIPEHSEASGSSISPPAVRSFSRSSLLPPSQTLSAVVFRFLDIPSLLSCRVVSRLFFRVSNLPTLDVFHRSYRPSDRQLTDEAMKIFQPTAIKAIRRLELGSGKHAPLSDFGLSRFVKLRFLSSLDFSWSHRVTDEGCKALLECLNLTALTVKHCLGLTDAFLIYCAQLPFLRYLDCSGVLNMRDDGFAALQGNSAIQVIIISENPQLTGTALKSIGKMKKVRRLEISSCSRLDERVICDFVRHFSPELTIFSVRNLPFLTGAFLKACEGNLSLTVIDLRGCTGIGEVQREVFLDRVGKRIILVEEESTRERQINELADHAAWLDQKIL